MEPQIGLAGDSSWGAHQDVVKKQQGQGCCSQTTFSVYLNKTIFIFLLFVDAVTIFLILHVLWTVTHRHDLSLTTNNQTWSDTRPKREIHKQEMLEADWMSPEGDPVWANWASNEEDQLLMLETTKSPSKLENPKPKRSAKDQAETIARLYKQIRESKKLIEKISKK